MVSSIKILFFNVLITSFFVKFGSYCSKKSRNRESSEESVATAEESLESDFDRFLNQMLLETSRKNEPAVLVEFCLLSCENFDTIYSIMSERTDELFLRIQTLNILDSRLVESCKDSFIDYIINQVSCRSKHGCGDISSIFDVKIIYFEILYDDLFNNKDTLTSMDFAQSFEYIKKFENVHEVLIFMCWNIDPQLEVWQLMDVVQKIKSIKNVMNLLFGLKGVRKFSYYYDHQPRDKFIHILPTLQRLYTVRQEIKSLIPLKINAYVKDWVLLMSILPDYIFGIDVTRPYSELKKKVESMRYINDRFIPYLISELEKLGYSPRSMENIKKYFPENFPENSVVSK